MNVKTLKSFAGALYVASLVRLASAVVIPVNCNIFLNSNAVQIAWNAYPGLSYVLQTTTNLLGPWATAAILTTTNNSISQSFSIVGNAQFFQVLQLDTSGPEIFQTLPINGAFGVGVQSTIQAWLRDASGVNSNTIAITVGSNAPVTLGDPRLAYLNGVLTYRPRTNEFLGTNGQIVSVSISAADMLGNQTTNFSWSFRLEVVPVISSNAIFLSPGSGGPCNLTLVSTNGDTFTFSYAGSCCLTNGTQLINTNQYNGYSRTVISFTDYPGSNIVVALTRPTKLAELLQAGTVSSRQFMQLTNSSHGVSRPKDLHPELDFQLQYAFPLGKVLYQTNGLLVETTPDSQLSLNAALQVAANFDWFQLTAFQAQIAGTASFDLAIHALATISTNFSASVPLIEPVDNYYYALIGAVPVWVDVRFEINAGYTANFSASAEITNGISATKSISVGKQWDTVNGWQNIYDNPPLSLTLLGPIWQIQGSADFRAYLQPKVTLLVYDLAGVSGDLEPYLELTGNAQLNPPQWSLGLYAGLQSTIGLDLSVWDDSWTDLPSVTLDLIPKETLWQINGPPQLPVQVHISSQPQSQIASPGSTVAFSVEAQGTGPLYYKWLKNGLYLTDDTRINGSGAGTLRIANVQTSDVGNYAVLVSGPGGSASSTNASLTLTSLPPSLQAGLLAYYPFDGGANDASGNGLNGTLENSPSFGPGVVGTAVYLDGQYVTLPSIPLTNYAAFTIALWARLDNITESGNGAVAIWYGAQGADGSGAIGMTYNVWGSGDIGFNAGGTTGEDVIVTPFPSNCRSNWAHYALVYNNGTLTGFINGQVVGTKAVVAEQSGPQAGIGYGVPDGALFVGAIDEVRIYGRALSGTEVRQLFNTPTNGGLIAYYPFNGNANDASGNGQNGTMWNSPTFVAGPVPGSEAIHLVGQGYTGTNGQYVTIPPIDFSTLLDFTVSLWANIEDTTSADGEDLISFGEFLHGDQSHTVHMGYSNISQGDPVTLFTFGAGTGGITIPFPGWGQWHRYSIVCSGGMLTAYLDAQAVGSTDTSVASTIANAGMGTHWWWNCCTSTRLIGDLSDVRIYNRALSPQEIANLSSLPK